MMLQLRLYVDLIYFIALLQCSIVVVWRVITTCHSPLFNRGKIWSRCI